MLRAFTEGADSGAEGSNTLASSKTWGASFSRQQTTAKAKPNHKRNTSAKSKVTFKPRTSASRGRSKSRTATAKRTPEINTNTTPITKRHKAFASLFISFVATSSIAMDMTAADEETFECANNASTTPLPKPPSKAHTQPTGAIKPSEIRKTRWKRFRYEMKLKMQSGRKGKGRQRADEVELLDIGGQRQGGWEVQKLVKA